jgi:hypothetical protein
MARFRCMWCAGPGYDGTGVALTAATYRRLGFGTQLHADVRRCTLESADKCPLPDGSEWVV